MKFSAFILLLGFATYYSETVSLTANNCAASVTSTPCSNKSACCSNKEAGMCTKDHQNQSSKNTGGGCNKSSYCFDCPLCYSIILENRYETKRIVSFFKIKYSTPEYNLIPGYISKQWKPPNVG